MSASPPRSPAPWLVLCLLALIAGPGVPGAALAADAPAHLASLRGSAVAIGADGATRNLAEDDALAVGERVRVGARSEARIVFADGTRFELGSHGAMIIEGFTHDDAERAESLRTRIVSGVFRFVTGLVARRNPSAVRVGLSVATIGIRGTSVVGEVRDTYAQVILLEPEEAGRSSAIEVSNAFGSVTIDEPGFGTEVPDAQSPPSPVRRMQSGAIQNLMRTFQNLQRIGTRRPRLR